MKVKSEKLKEEFWGYAVFKNKLRDKSELGGLVYVLYM